MADMCHAYSLATLIAGDKKRVSRVSVIALLLNCTGVAFAEERANEPPAREAVETTPQPAKAPKPNADEPEDSETVDGAPASQKREQAAASKLPPVPAPAAQSATRANPAGSASLEQQAPSHAKPAPVAPAARPTPPTRPPAASAAAQSSPADEQTSVEDSELEVVSVVVVGAPLGLTEPAGSYDVTTRRGLQDEHPNDTYELFNKTPGVSLSRYGQGIINTDIAIRGFAGDGTTPHAKLLIDGIPAHLHNGYGELDQMFSLGIGSIAVFKGTSDVRYGRFNTAGNYNVTSRSDLTTEFQATLGSFRSVEAQAYSGVDLGPVTQHLFVGFRRSSGYRDQSELEKYTASGRWRLALGDTGSLTFSGRFSGYDAESPGYLSAEEAAEEPRSSAPFADQDGGEKSTEHLSLHWEQGFFDEQLQVNAKLYRQAFERQRWVRFSEAGSLQERFDDQSQVGGIANAAWKPTEDWNITAGLNLQSEDVIEQRFGTIGQSRLRDTANTIRNFDHDLQSYGGYLSVENTLFNRLRWSVGLRADGFGGDLTSTDAEGESTEADIVDYDVILQPKVNVTAMVVDGLFVIANYGRSFQSPFGSALYAIEGTTRSTEYSVNDGWEVGAKVDLDVGLQARVSYWQQIASNEFVSVDGENQNVGKTSRSGVEGVVSWTPLQGLLLWGNLSLTVSEITEPGEDASETEGNRLRSVPDFTTSFGARYDISRNFFVGTHADGQGSYFVNEANEGGTFGDYLIVHAEGGYHDDNNRVQLQVNNLLNSDLEYVFDFSADGTATIHAPGTGFNANVSYTRTF